VREVRDERELVRRCREGSESAYAELVRSHRPRLYLLAYRLTGDRETAEDVVQETFLAAFRSIEKVDPRPSLNPWLNTIVLRVAGRLDGIYVTTVEDGEITAIRVVRNPDKLTYIDRQLTRH